MHPLGCLNFRKPGLDWDQTLGRLPGRHVCQGGAAQERLGIQSLMPSNPSLFVWLKPCSAQRSPLLGQRMPPMQNYHYSGRTENNNQHSEREHSQVSCLVVLFASYMPLATFSTATLPEPGTDSLSAPSPAPSYAQGRTPVSRFIFRLRGASVVFLGFGLHRTFPEAFPWL